MKKQKTQNLNTSKGITLIALVITIIVMLILVAVTISMAVNGGLFEHAGKAAGDTNNAMIAEGQLGNGGVEVDGEWYNSIDEYLEKAEGTEEEQPQETLETRKLSELVEVGDLVEYDQGTAVAVFPSGSESYVDFSEQTEGELSTSDFNAANYTGEWRVVYITSEYVYLMSDEPVGNLCLKQGNYGVPFDDICSAYVNETYADDGFVYFSGLDWVNIEGIFTSYWNGVEFWNEDYEVMYNSYVGGLSQDCVYFWTGTTFDYCDLVYEELESKPLCPIIKLKQGTQTTGKNAEGKWILDPNGEFEEPGEQPEEGETIEGNNGEVFTAIYGETKRYIDKNGDIATIPAGYSVGKSEGINAVDTGLVIRDVNGNEFVWIPVKVDLGSSYSSEQNHWNEPTEITGTYSGSGAAYDSQETLDYLYGENYYTYSEDFKYADEYSEMVEKVNKYNGFYIGRYETTIDSEGNIGSEYNTEVLTDGTTLFTKNSIDYPYRWYGLYYAQKNAKVSGNGTDVQTAMIYGVLSDMTMNFIREQKKVGNTNYDVDTKTSTWHGEANGHTGLTNSAQANTGDVALNIWDLESNATELTQQVSGNSKMSRGGNYAPAPSPAANRGYYTQALAGTASSRLVLYIK